MAAATAALVTAAAVLLIAVCPATAFVQLMGNSDVYCDAEGAYCRTDSSCCSGLQCVPRFGRIGGGVCRRREQQPETEADEPAAPADHAFPRYPPAPPSGSQSCQVDADCPAGQCCLRRSVGARGGGVSACRADCPENEVGNILADFYTRYYRRSLRDGPGKKQHGSAATAHKHRRHGEGDKKKKNA